MAERSGFFNSVNGDRKYDAARIAEYFSAFISNGVFPDPSTGLQVVSNGDMSLTVKAGQGWINGYHYINDSDLILNLEVAGGVLNRIDRIVLQFSTTDRVIAVKVKTGTLASSPVALALQRDADIYELGLADIYVGVGATSILQANITDLRLNSTYCGIVTGVIDQIDPTDLFIQYGDEFSNWFANIKNQLSTDAAGNLQNQIDNIEADSLFQTAGGTATAITLTMSGTLVNGYPINFVASANNSGAATTINGKLLYKPGTTLPVTLIQNKAYTVWYNLSGDCFFLKASATGTATKAQVLAGVPFSNQDDTDLVGEMINNSGGGSFGSSSSDAYTNSAIIGQASGVYVGAFDFLLNGYYNGTYRLHISNLLPENIKSGVNVGSASAHITGTCVPIPTPTAGATIIASSDVTHSIYSDQSSLATLKALQVSKTGSYRLYWTSRMSKAANYFTYRVYVNGNSVTYNYGGSDDENNNSIDLTLNAGDVVSIMGSCSTNNDAYLYIYNFRLALSTNYYSNYVTFTVN